MPSLIVTRQPATLRLSQGLLQVFQRNPETQEEELLREVPLRDVERVLLSEQVHLTSPVLSALLQAGIPIHFFSWSGRYLGDFLPEPKPYGSTRLRQYQRCLDPQFAHRIACRILGAKLYNQRRVLQRLRLSRQSSANSSAIDFDAVRQTELLLGQWMDQLHRTQTVDEVRGLEGAGTAAYYKAWAQFLPPEFPFERRSKRPPLNPVNACISFGATLLYHEAVAAIHSHGLDPAIGTLHTTENGRWSLALDLIEPFRPVLVEALTLDLFSHKILQQKDFEEQEGGVFLNESGRRKFFYHYEVRMEREFFSEAVGHRTTLRRQLDYQVLLFKRALDDPEVMDPFVMN